MLIMENEERRSLAGSVGITHGVRPLAALDIYRQLELQFESTPITESSTNDETANPLQIEAVDEAVDLCPE